MAEEIIINKDLSDKEIYINLLPQIESLLSESDHYLSNLSNFSAILNEAFDKISWVGFYLYDGNELYLGPFQGKLACTKIRIGKGVCGKSAETLETIIVKNVHEFADHIACDAGTNSEIVVPLLKDDKLLGVLDIDSYEYSAFDDIDKEYLENFVGILLKKITL